MRAGARPGRPDQKRRPSSPAEAPGLAERRAAAKAVAATLAREATLDEALAGHGDQPLVRAIAVTTFRHLGTILDVLAERMERGVPKEPGTVAILATGAAQVLFLDVADHAAVDLSVRLAREDRRTQHLAGMVNAVLRRIAREREEILPPLSATAELPEWLAVRWREAYGQERVAAIAAAHAGGAALDLTAKGDATALAESVGGVLLPTGSVRVLDRRPVSELPGYRDGTFWVQDAAAALPARLLRPQEGERILDLCAAPGGKTAQLAAAGARVTALDRSEARLERLHDNLGRLGLEAEIVCADALAYQEEPFDAVLLDAPCSATGTIRRHPDLPWTKSEADIRTLAAVQVRMLDRAARLVRPGGRLVYCVCSLEPEEGEQQVRAFLARHADFTRIPLAPGEHGIAAELLTGEGDLRTVPDHWPDAPGAPAEGWRPGLDGFYAACLARAGSPVSG
ncbi:RsmB/NOP family class I SAM-dependent RNA methyltransferase [Enterovirga rhinocerotis]|uniref:16S rRNA (Cytosine967-C5)-methyltransferase n=1 Tax=Enterovirga rhinocerotis TaxID=1339210 RepID=A0A4R7C8G8_9HYPH|nr:transcription antitermination factor NusB [Enterovirga rhinocerotis]TDR94934.1 16S rRNA (cytosine967-C5)-methyltransferase [Enterovirga rhinocerotis]